MKKDLSDITKQLHDFYGVYLLEDCTLFKRITKENIRVIATHLCTISLDTKCVGGICVISIKERIAEKFYETSYLVSDIDQIINLKTGVYVTNKSFLKALSELLYKISEHYSSVDTIKLYSPIYENSRGRIILKTDDGNCYEDIIDKRGIYFAK